MTEIPNYIVNAFTGKGLGGNPAAVCPLKAWPRDASMQAVAADNGLSETAFFVPDRDRFHLRWFSPKTEVDLCGHATLAAAHVLFQELGHKRPTILFDSKTGPLTVSRQRGGLLGLDFPALPAVPATAPALLTAALGAAPAEVLAGIDYVAVFGDEAIVREMAPDLDMLRSLDRRLVIVTAPGKGADYVLRVFGPKIGIGEDPVTGSAQCLLAPYWARRLGNNELYARQLSARGGELWCEVIGDRVKILGQAEVVSRKGIRLGG